MIQLGKLPTRPPGARRYSLGTHFPVYSLLQSCFTVLLQEISTTIDRSRSTRGRTHSQIDRPTGASISLRDDTNRTIHDHHELTTITQGWDEDEIAYAARINEAAYRCGNVHSKEEKMTKFVDGILEETGFPLRVSTKTNRFIK